MQLARLTVFEGRSFCIVCTHTPECTNTKKDTKYKVKSEKFKYSLKIKNTNTKYKIHFFRGEAFPSYALTCQSGVAILYSRETKIQQNLSVEIWATEMKVTVWGIQKYCIDNNNTRTNYIKWSECVRKNFLLTWAHFRMTRCHLSCWMIYNPC